MTLSLVVNLGVQTAGNNVVLLMVLPIFGNMLCFNQTKNDRDLIIARISVVSPFVGQVLFAFAPDSRVMLLGLLVWTLGTGVPCLCRAVLCRAVDRRSVGQLFGILAAFDILASLFFGVGFDALFQ